MAKKAELQLGFKPSYKLTTAPFSLPTWQGSVFLHENLIEAEWRSKSSLL